MDSVDRFLVVIAGYIMAFLFVILGSAPLDAEVTTAAGCSFCGFGVHTHGGDGWSIVCCLLIVAWLLTRNRA